MTSTPTAPVTTVPASALDAAARIAQAPTMKDAALLLANHVTAVAETWDDATLTAVARHLTKAYAARVDELDRAARTYIAAHVARRTGAAR